MLVVKSLADSNLRGQQHQVEVAQLILPLKTPVRQPQGMCEECVRSPETATI